MKLFIGIEETGRSRKWRRRAARSYMRRRHNSPFDNPQPGGATSPPPAPASPPPPPVAATSPPPPPAAVPSSAAGPGTSGLPTPGATPVSATPAQPGQPGQPGQPPAAPLSFEQQFRQRYNMAPDQAQMLMRMGYQQYQGQQTQPAPTLAPATPAQPNIFGLPQFDEKLLNFVAKDPATGQLMNLPGAPLDAAFRVQEYMDNLRQVQSKFFTDPMQFLEKPVAALVEKRAQELYQKQFSQHQQQGTAERILEENKSWLFEVDANGQQVRQWNPATGQESPVLSQWGRYYHQCIQQVAAHGITDPVALNQYAIQMCENAALRAKFQQSQAAPAGNAAAQQFLNGAAGHPTPAHPAAPNPPPPAQPAVPFSIKDRMRQLMDANGIDDKALQQQLNRTGA